jgi:hypothetical protein
MDKNSHKWLLFPKIGLIIATILIYATIWLFKKQPAQNCALPASCRCLFHIFAGVYFQNLQVSIFKICRCLFQILQVSISNFAGVHFKFCRCPFQILQVSIFKFCRCPFQILQVSISNFAGVHFKFAHHNFVGA